MSDSRWGSDLDSLKTVPSSAFEVVEMNPIYTSANYPTGAAQTISSFRALPTHVASGGSVTLSWTVGSVDYVIISPGPGALRDTSVTVNPTATTTYTLYATNHIRPHNGNCHSECPVRLSLRVPSLLRVLVTVEINRASVPLRALCGESS